MTRSLDHADIQGNVIWAYKLPFARYLFFQIKDAAAGRRFVNDVRKVVTTSRVWKKKTSGTGIAKYEKPDATLNIGFSWWGLIMLDLPTRTLREMPAEFINGMYKRREILGDNGPSAPKHWDLIWRRAVAKQRANSDIQLDDQGNPVLDADPNFNQVHIWISINATTEAAREQEMSKLLALESVGEKKVELLAGHGKNHAPYQDANILVRPAANGAMEYFAGEHFGFRDGISNPVFEGQYPPEIEAARLPGRGKLVPPQHAKDNKDRWAPLATGEFILGHADESQELPEAARPADLMRNGTFMAYRKLHQNVHTFHKYINDQVPSYIGVMGLTHNEKVDEARETIRAKMAGRWSDGIPLMAAPTWREWQELRERYKGNKQGAEFQRLLTDFEYANDEDGSKCPLGAHIRRGNTRDMLDPNPDRKHNKLVGSSALNKRRRILRRGLPYGTFNSDPRSDDPECGIIFMAVCSSLFRQFEFVQQQWIQFGMDFEAGNGTCPLIGDHPEGTRAEKLGSVKHVIAGHPGDSNGSGSRPPFICGKLPQFVETRGGEYFFLPSMTALRLIALGTVDPT